MRGLRGWVGVCCAMAIGCSQEPQVPPNSTQRIDSLLTENRRLHNELLEARKEVARWKDRSKVTSGREMPPKTDKPAAPVREKASRTRVAEEKLLPKEVELPSGCNGHLLVQMKGNPEAIIPVIEGRLKGWGLERLQVLNGREEGTLDIFFSGFEGGAQDARKSLEGIGGLSVHELGSRELAPFQIAEVLPDFRSLFPEEGSRVVVSAVVSAATLPRNQLRHQATLMLH